MKAPVDLQSDVGEVLVSEEQIQAKVRELGRGSASTTPGAS